MIDADGNVKSHSIKKGCNMSKQKKKVRSNGVILGRATEGDAEDSSVYTDTFNDVGYMT